jgi:hypothetical protein
MYYFEQHIYSLKTTALFVQLQQRYPIIHYVASDERRILDL